MNGRAGIKGLTKICGEFFSSRLIDETHSKCALHFRRRAHSSCTGFKENGEIPYDKITATRSLLSIATTLSYFCAAVSSRFLGIVCHAKNRSPNSF